MIDFDCLVALMNGAGIAGVGSPVAHRCILGGPQHAIDEVEPKGDHGALRTASGAVELAETTDHS